MEPAIITTPTADQFEWCAQLMAASEPWLALRRGIEECRHAVTHPEYLVHIAHSEDVLLGFIRIHPRGVAGSPYIASIAVAAEARSQGVGSFLLRHAEQVFSHSRYIFLCVSSFNPRAVQLYERRGYRALGRLPDYVIDGADEILMLKRLPA
jgi:ribosomal protein S18 acetylase RimI-like enzyme